MSQRIDHRASDQLRPVRFIPHYTRYAEGSVLIETGHTRVLCNVSVEDKVPAWREESGGGWLTAEYGMLPRSTHQRMPRQRGSESARAQEIRRLIGRSLRAAVNLDLLGPRTLTVDCDVIQADGGTRTASITGGYVAVALALRRLIEAGVVPPEVLVTPVAAVSVGVVNGELLLDLCYEEDAAAEVDFNVVMTGEGRFIEVQGTAEGAAFDRQTLDRLIDLAQRGIRELLGRQADLLAGVGSGG
ncbi:MAG: ribonuclease PH [Chloroflexi bacterium]|nr:MAG: ribonuclease PH [Chloroflexota bacterium]